MRVCPRCGLEKALTDFHKNYQRPDGCQIYCKPCRKVYDHDYYERTQQRLNERRRETRKAFSRARGQWLRSLKNGPCADCGGVFPPESMEWDHLPGSIKLGEISTTLRARQAAIVLAEIAKCELVCANCHAVRTRDRILARLNGAGDAIAEEAGDYRAA